MLAIDDLMDEFMREDGLFFGLHQRQFDPVAAERALQILRRVEIGADHGANYRLVDLLFNAQVELSTYAYRNRDDQAFARYDGLLFFEIAERFNAVGRLGETLRGN